MNKKLAACPFCDSRINELKSRKSILFDGWVVYCLRCDCEGPMKPGREESIKAWNTRPNQPTGIEIDVKKLASVLYLQKCDHDSLSLTDTDKVMIMEEIYCEANAIAQNLKSVLKEKV